MPELVTPYANSRPFSPWRSTPSTSGSVVRAKNASCCVAAGNTRVKVYVEGGGSADTRVLSAGSAEGFAMCTVVSVITSR